MCERFHWPAFDNLHVLYPLFLQSFMEACKTGNVGVVQLALEGGADPNQADEVMIMCVV